MNRLLFLSGAASALAAVPSPKPSVVHIESASPAPWDLWDKSVALPYDHPLEIEMELLDAGKEQFSLKRYRGRAVILNIFATWCGPCNHEQPYFVDVAAKYASSGLTVIGMDSKDEDDKVRAYRKKYGITYPIAMDRGGEFARALERGASAGATEFPVSIFFAPDGYLYGVRMGSMGPAELEYRVKRFLADVSAQLASPSPSPSPPTGSR